MQQGGLDTGHEDALPSGRLDGFAPVSKAHSNGSDDNVDYRQDDGDDGDIEAVAKDDLDTGLVIR